MAQDRPSDLRKCRLERILCGPRKVDGQDEIQTEVMRLNAKEIRRRRNALGRRASALRDLHAMGDLSADDYAREMARVSEAKRKLRAEEKLLREVETPNLPAVIAPKQEEEPRSSDPLVIGKPPKWSEQWWANVSAETQAKRCKARNRNGTQCQRLSISGARVCYMHGGASPQVRAAALARLQNGSTEMADHLLRLAKHAKSETVQLGATNSALDRAGIKTATEVIVTPGQQSPFEEVLEGIGTGSRAQSRRARGMQGDEQSTDLVGNQSDWQLGSSHHDQHTTHTAPAMSDRPAYPPPSEPPDDRDTAPDRSHRRPRSRRPASPSGPVITGLDAIAAANRANGLIDPDVYGLPPGRSGW